MILYSSDTCAGCKDLKKYLTNKGITYIERNCTDNEEYLAALLRTTNGVKLFPTLAHKGKYVVGLNWRAIADLVQ